MVKVIAKEEHLLANSIRDSFYEANTIVDKITCLVEGNTVEYISTPNTEMIEDDELLEWCITKLYRDVGVLAERMQVPRMAERIAAEFDAIKNINNVRPSNFDVGLVSLHLNRIRGHFETLATMIHGTEVTGLDVFRTILENTPAIVEMTETDPKKKSDVQKAMMKVLKIESLDAERETSISVRLNTTSLASVFDLS